jgi:hypothetical protein
MHTRILRRRYGLTPSQTVKGSVRGFLGQRQVATPTTAWTALESMMRNISALEIANSSTGRSRTLSSLAKGIPELIRVNFLRGFENCPHIGKYLANLNDLQADALLTALLTTVTLRRTRC